MSLIWFSLGRCAWGLLATFFVQLPSESPKPIPNEPDSNTVSASIAFKDVDVEEFLTKMRIPIGYRIAGKVTVQASISVPLGAEANTGLFTLQGRLTSPALLLEGLRVTDLDAKIVYANGTLTLSELKGTLPSTTVNRPGGTFHGHAVAVVDPPGEFVAKLTLTNLPIGELLKSIPGETIPITGTVNGSGEFRSPTSTLRDTTKWIASANLTSGNLTLFGRSAKSTKLKLAVQNGTARLTEASTVVEGIPVVGDGQLSLVGGYAFSASLRTEPNEVAELQKLVPELAIPVPIHGKLATLSRAKGTLAPFTIEATGTVNAGDFAVGLSNRDTLSAKWALSPERVTLSELNAGLFQGRLTGTATIPLMPETAGDFRITLAKVDAAEIMKAFPNVPVKLTGVLDGSVKGILTATPPGREREVTADMAVTAPKLTVQGFPAENLRGKLELDGAAVVYELEGKTLGGSFEVSGRYPEPKQMAQAPPDSTPAPSGMLRIRTIDLSRLSDTLHWTTTRLRGIVDLNFDFNSDWSEGTGVYSIRGFSVNNNSITPLFRGRIHIRNGRFELGDAVGPISGGTIRAKVQASLTHPARNFFRVVMERIELRNIAGVFLEDADIIQGSLSVTAVGKFYPEFVATGTLGLERGRVAGLSVHNVRLPFAMAYRNGAGKITIPEVFGSIGNGRITGSLQYQWGTNGTFDSRFRFTNVRVGNILADLRTANYFGNARVSGQLQLTGYNVRSVNDLNGMLQMKISHAALRDLPVIDVIAPFVPSANILKPFDSGDLRARLSRGVIRLERLALGNPEADLFADGTISLAGRLDLMVVLRTGDVGYGEAQLRSLAMSLVPSSVVIPLRVVQDFNRLLANRTVRVQVTGTLSHPKPRVNAVALLSDEAIRYILRRYLPSAVAAGVIPHLNSDKK